MSQPAAEDRVLGVRLAAWLGAAVGALGSMATAGWLLHQPWLASLGDGEASMSLATALCCIAGGLVLYAPRAAANGHRAAPRMALLTGALLLAVAGYGLAEQALGGSGYLLGAGFGRMAPATAACFALFGGALLSSDRARGRPGIALATLGLVIAALDLVSRAYGVALDAIAPLSAMALPTALAFVLLFAGQLSAREQHGWVQFLLRADSGGAAARLLAPAVATIPFTIGLLLAWAEGGRGVAPPFGLAIMAVATTVAMGGMVYIAAALLSQADVERSTATDALFREASEHHLTEERLTQSEKTLHLLVETAPAAIAMLDRDMRYLIVSRRFRHDYKLGEADLTGRSHYEVFPEIPERWREIHRRCLAGAIEQCQEEAFPRADGSVDWVRWEILPWRDEHGAIGGIVLMSEVITERKRAELALIESEKKLQQAQKMEAIGNLSGGMAHDFNNLLGVIIGNLDAVRPELAPGSDADGLVSDALDAALRGADLTRRLLAFARRQPLQPEHIVVNELVASMVKLLDRMLGEAVEVVLKLGTGIWPVIADPAQLESSLANLAANARDAMPGGGRLTITTDNRHLDGDYADQHGYAVAVGDYVMIEVSDTGCGMAPEVMGRIFEPFFSTKERGKGSGLGLSMVFGFIKQSGGHINVYSEPGHGTTFRLYLPRAAASSQADEAPQPAPSVARGSETLLVVEDSAALRRVVVRQLKGLGYRLLEAEDAAQALELLAAEPVDLLLTDVVMPGTNGLELARAARRRNPSLKVVLTSGFPDAKLDAGEDPLGGLRLVSKPYRRDELARVLREVLDGQTPA